MGLRYEIQIILQFVFVIYILTFKPQPTAGTFEAGCHKEGLNADLFKDLTRIRPDSKYALFASSSAGVKSIDEAIEGCQARDMLLAQIRTLYDYKSINDYLVGTTPNCENDIGWLIGGTDSETEGYWKYPDGTNLTFQTFYAFEPMDAATNPEEHGNWLRLQCEYRPEQQSQKVGYVYRDQQKKEDDKVSYICEYKPTSSCWKESVETQAFEKMKDKLDVLGSVENKEYYYAYHQKTWEQAVAICKANQMKLFDMEIANEEEAEDTYQLLGKFSRQMELMSITTGFLLYGSFSKFFTGNPVPFQWEWIDDKWRDKMDEANKYFHLKKGQMKYGKCISVGALYDWSQEDKPFTFSMAQCNIPHWTVCYKDKQKLY